ncbi:MAG: ATPase [Cetobacterium sp.]|uniref:ATPase n=1 Tax=Cetobacterium sp. TaxID=2071632 RepID=UPI002FC5C0E4
MFKNIVSNNLVKEFLENELLFKRSSGTYLFYGEDRGLMMQFALAFANGLNCNTLHGDLEILEDSNGVKIEVIRELAYSASVSSYEGGNKVFIITDVEKMKKESANAMLKLIEEPNVNCFFILMTSSLNILPTIKSRSMILKFDKQMPKDLDVTQFEYDFFLGDASEIEKYKLIKETEDLELGSSYEEIGSHIKNWLTTGEFIYKINLYKSIRDFIRNKDFIDDLDKIYFAEEILRGEATRDLVKEIVNYSIQLMKNPKNAEELLTMKGVMRFPVNQKNLLLTFFLRK